MAERRMFAKTIVDSDVFLDMPLSTQALYFHLAMRADDEGFVNNPKKIQKMIGASEDDLKLLVMKRYILTFESGIIVIKHWKIHNYIQNDRFKPTTYIEEKSQLQLDEKKSYIECIHNVSKMYTQEREDKGKLELEKNIERDIVIKSESLKNAREFFEILSLKYPGINLNEQVINETKYDLSKILDAISRSKFLQSAPLSFIFNNYEKVINGNYQTFKAKEDKGFSERHYTEEELKNVFDSLDDIEM